MNAVLTEEAFIALLKVALTSALVVTPVTCGELAAGDVEVTVGLAPATGAPRMGSEPPPQAASNVANRAAVQPLSERREREK